MNQLKKSIITTLCYSDIFNFPLTRNELYQNLISTEPVSQTAFNTSVETLHRDGYIRRTAAYFHLPGRGHIVKIRTSRQFISSTKQQFAKKVAQHIIKLPYVRAVFLTGAVAVNNAPPDDDIDIMIVAANHSLWTCRLLVNVWLDLHWLRRHPHDTQVTNKICANLFLSENSLGIPKKRQNNYTAHEIVQSIPLADPYHLHAMFIQLNPWIKYFLPHRQNPAPPPTTRLPTKVMAPEWLETMTRNMQQIYMKPRQTRETITQNTAYFHPRDTAALVHGQLKKKIQEFKI